MHLDSQGRQTTVPMTSRHNTARGVAHKAHNLPLAVFIFPHGNNSTILPDAGSAKQLRKLYPRFILPLYIPFHLCAKFTTAKCHDTAEHARPYPDTQGATRIMVHRAKLEGGPSMVNEKV
jgi:hypothetical protein